MQNRRKPFLIITAIIVLISAQAANAGTLSCSVTTAAACTGTVIYRMSGSTNAHAELSSQANANYDSNVVCCSGVTGLGASCTGTFATALKLSGATNAHAEQNTQANYANNACISVPSGGSVSVGYQATNCTGFDTTLGSMTGVTNAHVGDGTAYTTKICATASGSSPVYSVSITTSGVIAYGFVALSTATSTVSQGYTQTAQNDGNTAEKLNVKSSNATGGTSWTLASAIGTLNEFKHEFSTTTGSIWTTMPTVDTYVTAAPSVAQSGTVNFDFRLTVPSASSDYQQKSITITVQAVAP